MSALTQYLLHTPWWVAGGIILVGLAVLYSGNRRQDKTLLRIGAALFALGLILGILGWLFPSDRQKVEKRTKEMVAAVNKGDWNSLRSLLDDQTAMDAASHTVTAGREEILREMKMAYDKYGVKSAWVLSMQTRQTDTLITILLDVISTQEVTQDRPEVSHWQLDYEQFGNGWMLQKITLTSVGGDRGEQQFNPFTR
ncbi:MAG: hypothetical protein ABR964_07925 [Tepidisphaeraceae bacterium]|jgi:hypothetical protein